VGISLKYLLGEASRFLARAEPRPFLRYAAEKIGDEGAYAVEAPTGYGKTTLSVALAAHSVCNYRKSIVAYPTRTLIEDQAGKFASFFSSAMGSDGAVGVRYMGRHESRYFVRPVTLTTVDTLALTMLGLAPEDLNKVLGEVSMGHYLFSRGMFILSDMVMDEVHLLADGTKSLSFLVALLGVVAGIGQRVVMLSATLPRSFAKLLEAHGVKVVRFSESPDSRFLESRRRKKYDVEVEALGSDWREKLFEKLRQARRGGLAGGRAIAVFNTVDRAVAFYDYVVGRLGELGLSREEVVLLHSRFSEKHRVCKAKRLEGCWRLLVATQAIEVGVDVSSTLFISELAPANSLIQRFGRFLRREEEQKGHAVVWYDKEGLEKGKKYTVYDLELTKATLEEIEGQGEGPVFHDPDVYSRILDEVYSEDVFKVDDSYVGGLRLSFLDLSKVSYAAKLFRSQEGSLVRDEALVPAVASSVLEGLGGRLEAELLAEYIVPVSLPSIEGRVVAVVKREDGGRIVVESFGPAGGGRRSGRVSWEDTLDPRFVAYVVRAGYDPERGLVWEQ